MNGRESSERVCVQWGQRLFERIQEDIDSERDRITSVIQAMLNNAKEIARFNDVEDQLQMTLGYTAAHQKGVYAASEKSFFEEMSILAVRLAWIRPISIFIQNQWS